VYLLTPAYLPNITLHEKSSATLLFEFACTFVEIKAVFVIFFHLSLELDLFSYLKAKSQNIISAIPTTTTQSTTTLTTMALTTAPKTSITTISTLTTTRASENTTTTVLSTKTTAAPNLTSTLPTTQTDAPRTSAQPQSTTGMRFEIVHPQVLFKQAKKKMY